MSLVLRRSGTSPAVLAVDGRKFMSRALHVTSIVVQLQTNYCY